MMEANVPAAYVILTLSICTLVGGIILLFTKRKYKIWGFAGLMLLTVLLLQVSLNVAYPYDFDATEEEAAISGFEMFVRIIAYTLQSFSLDLGYVEIIRLGSIAFPGAGAIIFDFMACAMTFIAPATGGFAVFGLLIYFFPILKMLFLCGRRTRYVFSELNECSIETAESIYNKIKKGKKASGYDGERWKRLKSSIIVFTDAYMNRDEEKYNELLERARNIGAVCLKTDINDLNLYWAFRRADKKEAVYFLMDANEENNLTAAVNVLSRDKNRWAKDKWTERKVKARNLFKASKMSVYVFTRNDDANSILQNAYKQFVTKD